MFVWIQLQLQLAITRVASAIEMLAGVIASLRNTMTPLIESDLN